MTRIIAANIVTSALILGAFTAPAALADNKPTAQERVILDLVNARRAQSGVPALQWGPRITDAAKAHSADMVKNSYVSHLSPTAGSLRVRLRRSGIGRWDSAIENLTSAGTPTIAFNKLRGRTTTRQRMLMPKFTHIGIGIVDGGPNGLMVTMDLVEDPKVRQGMPTLREREVFKMLNDERRKNGLPTLKWGLKLKKAARAHSIDMIKRNYFSHTSPDGGKLPDRLRAAGLKSWSRAGENLAGALSGQRAFELWLKSSKHERNMLNPNFTHAAVAIVDGGPYGAMITMELVQDPN